MKHLLLIALLILSIIAWPAAALASDISEARYYGTITISNNSTAPASEVAVALDIDNDVFIDGGYLNATLSNGTIRSTGGSDIAFMPGYDTNNWILYVPTIGANSYLSYILYTANTTDGSMCYFPGVTGATIYDDSSIELGDNYTVELKGQFDTTVNGYAPLNKSLALGMFYNSGDIDIKINNITRLSASSVNPGTHTITVSDNGANSTLEIDGSLIDSTGSYSVNDNANNWALAFSGGGINTMLYVEYLDINIDGLQKCRIEWEYDNTTFTDLSGNGNDASVSAFRTTTTTGDNVTAVLTSFQPIAEAQAPAYALGTAPDFIGSTANISGNFTTTPGAGTFPLAGVITSVATASETPPQLPLLLIAVFIMLTVSLSISAVMRKYGSGSLLVKIGAICLCMLIFIGLANFGIELWILIVFAIIASAIAFASRQLGWT